MYRSPEELRADAAVARAAGVLSLTAFDLGGMVRRGPPEAWLAAFTSEAAAVRVPVATSRRIKLLVRALGGMLPLK